MKDAPPIIGREGVLFVLSAPSGGGKSTLRAGLQRNLEFAYSVSCTTRQPRPGEVDGKDYHFLSREAFEGHIAAGDFLEYATVHGQYYGTLKGPILEHLQRGGDMLIDIDVKGAQQIRSNPDPVIAAALVDLFLLPPPWEELESRLRARGTESEENLALRLRNAVEETAHWPRYRYVIPPGNIEETLTAALSIMRAERMASRRQRVGAAFP